ncbi:MAG: cysteine--tRNA ligase [Thermoprotei archaeon]|nr:MAG: cysteine--tRNA ligase [Thermoprotei archaeon]
MLKITDTLRGTKEEFKPLKDDTVTIYICGPTVYDYTHIGHARTYIAFDVIVRYLKYKGYKVKYVVNITDVEDKIIRKAKELGTTPEKVARTFEKDFFEVSRILNLLPADYYPRVTEHIEDIIKVVQTLIEKGYAYSVDGDVYFDVTKFKDYGKLSKQKLEALMAGARIEVDERKRNPADFALWKRAKEGEPAWKSPWGYGRPGWHIECTVMSIRYLGEQIDIHGGGADLIFPHHENEIAQSEAYTGKKPFVRYWLHTGLLQVKGEKMSKSLGNIISVREFVSKYPPDVLRFIVVSSHYRSPIEFSFEKAEQAKESVGRIHCLLEKLRLMTRTVKSIDIDERSLDGESRFLYEKVNNVVRKFEECMDNDFHTPSALAKIFELVSFLENILYRPKIPVSPEVLRYAYDVLRKLLKDVLGFRLEEKIEDSMAGLIDVLLEVREKLRLKKDWETADYIRDKLRDMGIVVEDTQEGPIWKVDYRKLYTK